MGRRILHSERFARQPRMMSSSVGANTGIVHSLAGHDEEVWEDDDLDADDELAPGMVPNSLHDLLTPAERMRRMSNSHSGLGTPAESSSKIGSPSANSPSRFSGFFAGRMKEAGESSPFGPVGSPLKNSGLHPGASPSLRATANARPLSGDLGSLSSPPRQGGMSMGMLSQQLSRTRLSAGESQGGHSPLLHPGIQRVASGSSVGSSPASRLDRAVSSSSVGRDKIDEEPEELFSMDEISTSRLDETANPGGKENSSSWKRASGNAWAQGSPFNFGKASPRLAPVGGQRTAAKPISRPAAETGEP